MIGLDDAVAGATRLIDDAINKVWPDPAQKASAEAITIKATTDAALAQMAQRMSVIVEEAKSADPWTSRARPSFLYVMYIMILVAIPYAVLWAFEPAAADRMATGLQKWLAAIPSDLWNVFGVGYLGYAVARSGEKAGGIMPFLTGSRRR